MGRRATVDEKTAAIATERLARLLADLGPRRALPERRDGAARDQPGTDPPEDDADAPSTRDQEASRADHAVRPTAQRVAAPPRPSSTESLSERARIFGRAHLGVVALVLVIGLAAGGWALLRARPVAEAMPLTVSTTAEPNAATTGSRSSVEPGRAPSPTPSPPVLVHVLGAVRNPGVVSLPERARVQDAIEKAGGLTHDARPGELNLAQVVQDGQQIVIGTGRHPGGVIHAGSGSAGDSGSGESGRPSSAGGGTAGAVIDLNTATLAQLDTLPGIGPVTAGEIMAWRTEHGRFSAVEELQEVDGIGPKTYAQIAPHVRV
jgi:competence protein ComEA